MTRSRRAGAFTTAAGAALAGAMALGLGVTAGPGVARADDAAAKAPPEKEACIAASDDGQESRDDGKYQLARDAFMRCARATCPSVVRRDCLQWLVDLEQRAPTVVIRARDDRGGDLIDVAVTLDGAPLTEKLDGEPIRVDPGEHRLHFVADGFAPAEERVVIQAGTKNRLLEIDLARPAATIETSLPATTPAAPAPAGDAEVRPLPSAMHRPPLSTWILGGVALAAFTSETYFAIAGMSQRAADLGAGGCAPRCTSSEVGSIQTKFIVADVSLGAGLLSAGLATYFFFRPRTAPSFAAGVAPAPGGAAATLAGHF